MPPGRRAWSSPMAHERGLDVQFELGKKHDGAFGEDVSTELIAQGQSWLDAGAEEIVVEAREIGTRRWALRR